MVCDSWFFFSWTTTIRKAVGRLDLRFESQKVELKYRQHSQSESFATAALSGIVYSCSQLATYFLHLMGEDELRLQLPSRAAYLAIQALAIAGMCSASVGSLMKSHVKRLEACCWELVWAIVLTLNMLACVLRTQQLERAWDDCSGDLQDFIRSQQFSCFVAPTAFVAACCQMLPVRCIVLLPLSCFALSISIGQVVSWTCQPFAGDEAHQSASSLDIVLIVAMVAFILVMLYGAAHRVEKMTREQWLTSMKTRTVEEASVQRRLGKATLARDLKVFRAAGCHAIVSLRQDLRVRMRFGDMAENFFGRDVNGISFLDLVDSSSRKKVDKVCKRVDGSRIPRSITATLICKGEFQERCRLLLVFHGQQSRHILVGIRARNTEPKRRRRPLAFESVPDEAAFVNKEDEADVPNTIPASSAIVAGRRTCKGSEKKKKAKTQATPLQYDGMPSPSCPNTRQPFTVFDDSDDYSGSSSTSSLMYTDSSEEDIAGIGTLCSGQEIHVQTDAQVGMKDVCIETDIGRRGDRFKCRCCAKPPAPLDVDQIEKIAAGGPSRHKKRRKAGKNTAPSSLLTTTIENLQGTWTIHSQFIGIAQCFMHRLTFTDDRCIDAAGKCWKLHSNNGSLTLIKGRLWVDGDVLYREGKSGIVITFQRQEEGAVILEQESDGCESGVSASSDDEQPDASYEELEEEDSILLLEQMVGQIQTNEEAHTMQHQGQVDLDDDASED